MITDPDEQLRTAGYVVLDNVLTTSECERYIELLEECVEKYSGTYASAQQKSAHGLDDKKKEKIVFNLHNKHPLFVDLIDHHKTFPVIKKALQDGSYKNSEPLIHSLSSARSPLKGDGQQLHINSRYPGGPFALTVTVIYCLDDFTVESGATRVVPGSHLRTCYAENGVKYPDEVILTAPKGSVIVFNGALWHGSSEKMTDATRWGAIYSYARSFIKPSFDLCRNVPEESYRKLTHQQKELLGFDLQPPLDEFTRISRRSPVFEEPKEWYNLPSS